MKPLTIEEARCLRKGTILYAIGTCDSRGLPRRWKVTSVKALKTKPDTVRIGLKYGLYTYGYATEENIASFSLEDGPVNPFSQGGMEQL